MRAHVILFAFLVICLTIAVRGNILSEHHDQHHDEDDGENGLKLGEPATKTTSNFKLTIIKGTGKKLNKLRNGRKFQRRRRKGKKGGRQFNSIDNSKNPRRPFPFRIPRTGFSCKHRAPGYYADIEAGCYVYRMCTARGGGQAFICPMGTKFNQRTLVCDHEDRVKCSQASSFFHRNVIIHEASMKATRKAEKDKSEEQAKVLRKRPRLQTSPPIIAIKRPSVIRPKVNGRLSFAPLFEEKRKNAFENFAKALDKSPSRSHGESEEEILGLKNNEKPFEDEDGKLQLLPAGAAGKSVAKFRKDPEKPALDLGLVPPPPVQLVGHVVTENELSSFPDSPIIKIHRMPKKHGGVDGRLHTDPHPLKKHHEDESSSNGSGRGMKEAPRSSNRLGLPVQLKPRAEGLPAPLVWISPASLARSPMVTLRQIELPTGTHSGALKSGNFQRALTMTFPGLSQHRFERSCLECISIKGSSSECPACLLV